MALMPEDIHDKRFTPVRFSEGYDMDEVDNYLDSDVIPRLRDLIDENERLKRELDEANNRIAELESAEGRGAVVDTEAAEVETPETEPEAVVEETDVVEETPAAQPAAQAAPDESAAGIIALAHRLHDEHVKNGEDERDRLISEANAEHRRIIEEAEETSRTTLENLEEQKSDLEKQIDSLRTFERDYRNRLRNYLENQLRDLDTNDTQEKKAEYGL